MDVLLRRILCGYTHSFVFKLLHPDVFQEKTTAKRYKRDQVELIHVTVYILM